MSDMVERVAKAIKSGMDASGVVSLAVIERRVGVVALQQFFEVLAMDAIEAMRDTLPEAAAIRRLFDEALE